MPGFLEDSKGNSSSLRLILTVLGVVFLYFAWLFQKAFLIEITRQAPDYRGLAELFIAMFVSFILAIFAKVIQKKYE
jgi:hypothetical protein